MLTEEGREARNSYYREYNKRYRKAHPEKAKKRLDDYWNRKAIKAKNLERETQDYAENRQKTDCHRNNVCGVSWCPIHE